MNKILSIALFVGLCIPQLVFSQDGGEDTLKTRIIQVIDYKPTISDAKKLVESPSVVDTNMEKSVAKYTFERKQLELTYQPDTIKPAKMKSEPLEPLYRSYVKAGAGNGINYLLDAYVNTLRSRDGELGVAVHGYGSEGALSGVNAPYSRWNARVSGKKFLKKHEVVGEVGYDLERLTHYGYDETNPYYLGLSDPAFRQLYNEIFANVEMKSFYTDSSKVNHKLNLHYDHWFDKNALNKEHNIVFDAMGSRFFGKHLGRAEFLTDVNMVDYAGTFYAWPYDSIAEKPTNIIFGLKPQIVSQGEKWRLELGLAAQVDLTATTLSGTRTNTSLLSLYPALYAKYNLVKEVIIPYASATGGVQRNNFNNLTENNPFLWTSLTPLRNTNEVYNISGGFRGSVSERFTYNLFGGQKLQRNAPLFVNYNASQYNPSITVFGENYFNVIYDTLQVIELGGELTYRIDEKLHVVGSGVYRAFEVSHEAEAWHRPNFEIKGTAFYQLKHKLIFKGEVHVLGPQKYRSYDATDAELTEVDFDTYLNAPVFSGTLDPIFDFNVGAEYRYTERLSGFINLNNILFQSYRRWNQYQVQRLNVVGGITYSFWKD